MRCSIMITGLSSRIAVIRQPLASCGVLGATTRRPGICMKYEWNAWLCCAPCPQLRPMIARITSGTRWAPENM
jgi:hypothetical protein